MKLRLSNHTFIGTAIIVAVGMLASAVPTLAAATTNAPAPAEFKPVRSVFVVPTGPQEGKDPFFPRSIRAYGTFNTPIKTGSTNNSVVEFALNGISGSAEKPLAIINNVTFGVNDDNDVIIKGRRIRVHCVEISLPEGRVRIQMGSEMRDLRLPLNK